VRSFWYKNGCVAVPGGGVGGSGESVCADYDSWVKVAGVRVSNNGRLWDG
jgi:hypothetical protein